MSQRGFFKKIFAFVTAIVIVIPMLMGGLSKVDPQDPLGVQALIVPPEKPKAENKTEEKQAPVITGTRRTHILYGDRSGGGHLHGQGKPCKSEFPVDWNADKIITTVERAAANDNLPWKQQNNGYYVADIMADDLRMRIVLNDDKSEVVTAYPLNMPRNPCPANDN